MSIGNKKNKKLNKKSGYTMVEMMVAIGLFVYIAVISLGAVVAIYDDNRKTQSLASVMNNLNYSLEDMTRSIRFSNAYHCDVTQGSLTLPNSCASGATSFAVSSSTDLIAYRWNNNTIEKSVNNGTYTPAIGSDVTLTYAKFYVVNTTQHDNRQPYIILVLRGYAGSKPSSQTNFDIETMVSQRQLDL